MPILQSLNLIERTLTYKKKYEEVLFTTKLTYHFAEVTEFFLNGYYLV